MDLDLSSDTFTLKLKGKKVAVRFATRKEVKEYASNLTQENLTDEEANKVLDEILIKHGVPAVDVEDLPLVHIKKIFEAITSPK